MASTPDSNNLGDDDRRPELFGAFEFDAGAVYLVYCELPPRERQVLDLLVSGLEYKQIASRLGNRPATVRVQLTNLREKFGVESNQQLALLALRMHCEVNSRE